LKSGPKRELSLFAGVVTPNRNSVVSIRDGGLLMCLGTVMSADGYILTKASELQGAIDPEVILPDGRRFKARELATDYAFDLMLLRISGDRFATSISGSEIDPQPWANLPCCKTEKGKH
jgi:serine protease Do